jgi:hypothetical protein
METDVTKDPVFGLFVAIAIGMLLIAGMFGGAWYLIHA